MQHDEFIGLVQDRAALDSRGAAEGATRATLETLAERLGGGLPGKVGDQLPSEIGRHLQPDKTERFGITDFWDRVAQRETAGVDAPEAAIHARAVMSVVNEAVTGDQFDRVKDELPADYDALFDFAFTQ